MNTKLIILLVVGVVLFSGLFFVMKPKSSKNLPTRLTSDSDTILQTNNKVFELDVKGKKITVGPSVLTATEGDNIVIKITSDEAEELHLHGYNKSIELTKDVPSELSFVANLTGRFELELEKSKTELIFLEVFPK